MTPPITYYYYGCGSRDFPTRVSVFSPEGRLISRFSGSPGGVLEAPHGICVDDEGSVYVAEIGGNGRGQRLQKFAQV